MSDRYPGGLITKTPVTPTASSASGIWTLEQQAYYKAQGTWPSPPYLATNSLRFRASNSAYLSRTPASAGNRQKWTWSGWVKIGQLGTNKVLFSAGTAATYIRLFSDNTLGYGVSGVANFQSTGVLRDPSAWYHIVCSVDTTLASNRVTLYVNNQSFFTTDAGYSQNDNTTINNSVVHAIGRDTESASNYLDGCLTEVNFVDGQALTPSSFGITSGATGVWEPKLYTGSYGTNGFYLPFTDIALTSGSNAGLGKDFSGNGNYWTTNNISVTSGSTYDAMTDVPTLTSATAGNYCVMNPLDSLQTVADGNLVVSAGATWYMTRATMGMSSGKWYWETQLGGSYGAVGISKQTERLNQQIGETTGACGYVNNTGEVRINNIAIATYSTWTSQIIGMAYDADNGKLWFSKDGTWLSGDPSAGTSPTASGLSGTYFAGASVYSSTESANFGQRPFTYTPPSGFKALNTYNLATPTVLQGDDYFAATIYTGNGATKPSSQAIVNSGFQPDFVWIKSRSNAYPNFVWDVIRGITNNPYLITNSTDAQAYDTTGNQLSSFNSNGFSVQNTTAGSVGTNDNGATFVAWQWKANGAGVSNTDGSITSTVSANQTSGFSVVTWTGNGSNSQSVGHGLGVTPLMVIIKARSTTSDWVARTTVIDGSLDYLILNTTAAAANSSDSAPTSTVINISNTAGVNTNGVTYVAYCFAPIAAFSAMGTYTGNGSSSGPFIYTGFRPAYVLVKGADYVTNWNSWDAARNTYNWTSQVLRPNSSAAEFNGYTSVGGAVNLLSNGFQIVKSDGDVNNSGSNFIYMAFAENPFKYALAR